MASNLEFLHRQRKYPFQSILCGNQALPNPTMHLLKTKLMLLAKTQKATATRRPRPNSPAPPWVWDLCNEKKRQETRKKKREKRANSQLLLGKIIQQITIIAWSAKEVTMATLTERARRYIKRWTIYIRWSDDTWTSISCPYVWCRVWCWRQKIL